MKVTDASEEFVDGIDLERGLQEVPVVIAAPSFCGVCGGRGGTMLESKAKDSRVYTRTGVRACRIFEYHCREGECAAVCGTSMCTMRGVWTLPFEI